MKPILIALFMLAACKTVAQTNNRALSFAKGDKFKKQVFVKSICVLQQGTQTVNIQTFSAVTKLYSVNNVSDNAFSFKITTQKIVDTINALGKQMAYDSEKPGDPNSIIERELNGTVGKPASVDIDKTGIISAVDNASAPYANDTVLAFSGIQPEKYNIGGELGLTARFAVNPSFVTGYKWTDSSVNNNIKKVTNYRIELISDTTTTVSFTSSIFENYFNTNINGVLVIDNNSGIVLQRITQSSTTGFEVLNGLIYTETRRNAISEVCYKQ